MSFKPFCGATHDPSPAIAAGRNKFPFSRCVFCSHPRHEARHCQKRRRALDLRRMNPAVERPDHHDRRRRKTGCKSFRLASGNQRKAERRQTRVYLLALRQARTLQGALACRRSTAVLPLGLYASQGAVSDQVSRRWRQGGGGLPPAPTPVTASTSHAGHSAGGHDVRYRPSATGTNPLRAGTASRSRQPESPADVLAQGARGPRFYS